MWGWVILNNRTHNNPVPLSPEGSTSRANGEDKRSSERDSTHARQTFSDHNATEDTLPEREERLHTGLCF